MKKIEIYKVKYILEELEDAIINKKPFSLIRIGDGGIDFLRSVLINNTERLIIISEKEGIPPTKIYSLFYLFGKYLSQANFIDTPEVYFNNDFWPRFKRPKISSTLEDWRNICTTKMYNSEKFFLMKQWKDIYYNSEINNSRYCNPEFNFLSLLRGVNEKNLIDIIRKKTVYCITNNEEVKPILQKICNVKIIEIVGWHKNLYKNNYKSVSKFIKKNASRPDIWLMGAGEWGRVFSGMIKQHGGRTVDMGSIFGCWCGRNIPKRLEKFIFKLSETDLEFGLTKEGKKYKTFI